MPAFDWRVITHPAGNESSEMGSLPGKKTIAFIAFIFAGSEKSGTRPKCP